MIANKVSQNFARQIANCLLISKINYHIEIWGNTSKINRKKIERIMIKAAKIVLGRKSLGRTDEWLLREMKWLKIEKMYENQLQNFIYKIMNSENQHYFNYYMKKKNRSIRIKAQNKVGHHDGIMGQSIYSQQSILYQSVQIYNKLPKELTLIKKQHLFKKWVKRFNLNNNIILKQQEDYNKDDIQQISEEERRINCQNEYENKIV